MGKKAKRERLRENIAVKIERIKCLLDKLIFATDNEVEKDILASIAYDETKSIDKFNQKMYKYL